LETNLKAAYLGTDFMKPQSEQSLKKVLQKKVWPEFSLNRAKNVTELKDKTGSLYWMICLLKWPKQNEKDFFSNKMLFFTVESGLGSESPQITQFFSTFNVLTAFGSS
jgi:hypothetical protein